jgi:hypothetical protein
MIRFILSDDFKLNSNGIKIYQQACNLYWVLCGEGNFPINVYPEVKVLDAEKLYKVF